MHPCEWRNGHFIPCTKEHGAILYRLMANHGQAMCLVKRTHLSRTYALISGNLCTERRQEGSSCHAMEGFTQFCSKARAGSYLLPDITALGEIHGVELVISHFQQQGAVINCILPAFGNAKS